VTARRRTLPMPPRLLSKEQLGEYLQCSPGTVDQLVADGLLPPPRKWRGLSRFDRVVVDAVLDKVYGIADTGADESITEAIDGRTRARALR